MILVTKFQSSVTIGYERRLDVDALKKKKKVFITYNHKKYDTIS